MKNSKEQQLAKYPKRFDRLKAFFMKHKIPARLAFLALGIASTVWFLVRVIPKPSRAGYPCMRAATPFMSSFVLWILGVSASLFAFKKSKQLFIKTKYLLAGLAVVGGIAGALVAFSSMSSSSYADMTDEQIEHLAPNQPMGTAVGVMPGRVVWVWDADATDETCENTQEDPYYDVSNHDQTVVDKMVDDAIKKLADQTTVADAWTELFKNFNSRKGKGAVDYVDGETVFIKINQGTASWLTDDGEDLSRSYEGWKGNHPPIAETSTAAMLAILRHLVDEVGVAEEDIYIGDPIAHIYKHAYDAMVAEYPDVNYVDKDAQYESEGRYTLSIPEDPVIYWSDEGETMGDAVEDYLYTELQDADYLINLAALKAHARAGITLCAKNHFGSHTRESAGHLHPGLIAPVNDVPETDDYDLFYRVQVDIMGHENLGGNTVLFFVDGLWGGTEATEQPVKWQMAPFNDDWPNSIFVSQDQVALESVCFDFLREEAAQNELFNDRPLMVAADEYLEHAADPANWPDGVTYAPDVAATTLTSLGTHEHWNNPTLKNYSRNLDPENGTGIELAAVPSELVTTQEVPVGMKPYSLQQNYPNPFSESTQVSFQLMMPSQVDLTVFNIKGEAIRTLAAGSRQGGAYNITWDAKDSKGQKVANGVYFCRLQVVNAQGEFVNTRMMLLSK